MKTVSIREVAREAGVSVATVSNVLNRPEIVASRTRNRVQAAIEALGYVPNLAARQLSNGSSTAVGIVLFDVRNPFLAGVARGAEDFLYGVGQTAVLCNTDVDADREQRYLDMLAQQRAQGVLVTPAALTGEWLDGLRDRGLRAVLFHNSTDYPHICSVAVDDVGGGELAATHLLARGHRHIACVTGPSDMRQSIDRLEGCHRAVARAGLPADSVEVVEVGAFTLDQGRRAGERILTSATSATAVFCANDLLALGVMQVVTRAGLRVPEDLAVVGYDDIDAAATAGVPLTTVHVDGHELGRAAARLLVDEVTNPNEHRHRRLLFSPRLVERASS
ncbi:LacI family DNA-binding transcriptional regulator [Thermobifida halotolerans]|uniref:LacI family DNA-binding transcriptional regulator n=1 Tax=Thermobifida halotolerans TaxID=483545 RepID=A0AA97M0D4_9ACTN|nr:LacI family DNA-binding transcriptional regulator [Thermobifida halotolerans]UOE21163.1 LacI family DNA-binding transcriptional regulator [Thermobifida halotolerans]